jgi:Domain of unknown function (DUF4922)
MNWDARILPVEAPDFRSRVEALIRQQLETWPMLREAVAGLAAVEYKPLRVKEMDMRAQFNPKRLASASARVDAAAIGRRPCFLCADNLPPEEKAIPFGDDFMAICNPFPILENHLVISARRHTPQTIAGNFETLLELARELGAGWFALYNGPRCGASAPDHMHFQACSRQEAPVLQALAAHQPSDEFPLRDLNALIERGDKEQLHDWLEFILEALAQPGGSGEEPMINLIVAYENGAWTAVLYPRRKHRPSAYDAEGDAKLTVSPGAVDLLGLLVVPDPAHFARITARDAEQIFDEVLLADEDFDQLLDLVIEEFD